MQLTAVGLNHQTAPLNIREKLAFAASILPDALQGLINSRTAQKAMILFTCNRTEIYCVGEPERIIEWLAKYQNMPATEICPYLYVLGCSDAIHHAFVSLSV